MDLQYLSGFDDGLEINGPGDGMEELGRIIQKRMGGGGKKSLPMKSPKCFRPKNLCPAF